MQDKSKLKAICVEVIAQRITNLEEALEMARQSANEEGKSSAGDKHETGRAMAQLEQEKLGKQLADLQKQMLVLQRMDCSGVDSKACLGSLVISSTASYFIAVAAGKIDCEQDTIYAVSLSSPIGSALLGKSAGESISINGVRSEIKAVL